MPYIKDRKEIDQFLGPLLAVIGGEGMLPFTTGELNYMITRIVDTWAVPNGDYGAYNSVIGVLECVKQEYYRRRVAVYEDRKKEENGEVYV